MASDSVNRATDKASHLEGRLTVIRADDGGAQAVAVELHNTSPERDVVLRVNSEMSAFIMQTIADQEGNVLSSPARKFSSSEVQRHGTVRIARGASHRWQVPIAAQLPPAKIPAQGLDGRLVVAVALQFSDPGGGQQPADADFETFDPDALRDARPLHARCPGGARRARPGPVGPASFTVASPVVAMGRWRTYGRRRRATRYSAPVRA